jgi:FkbM family methyltransferase
LRETLINEKWTLILPDHRADRPEWPWWEQERLASMHSYLGEGGHTVFDIGAEEGDFPALWSSWGNDVVLFEPNPKVWPNIRAIWEANELKEPLGWVVGFASDRNSMAVPSGAFDPGHANPVDGWPACAYGELIGDHGFLNLWERNDVSSVTIDTMSLAGTPPSAITMDIEGAELVALRGAVNTLIEHRPLVWVSVHPFFMEPYGYTDADVHKFMDECGYDAELLASNHEEHWLYTPR